MSIWGSYQPGIAVPWRDNYSGEDEGDDANVYVDVATASWFHNLVRLSVGEMASNAHCEVLLRPDEVATLITMLMKTLERDEPDLTPAA